MTEAYPLSWPTGWPRHKGARDSDSRFRGPTYRWDRVYHDLQHELRRIDGYQIVVSTNQPLRQDGVPYAQQRIITDPGVAVYFMREGKALVMAQDRFDTIIGNMRSLTMAIEGLRQMERHGGAVMLERAFDGFAALPPPENCWSILGVNRAMLKGHPKAACRNIITVAFREKVKLQHENDPGADMDRLVKARDQALEQIDA
jgi:hypothetical protein